MLLTSGAPPAGELWAAEVKWDGIRAQVRLDRGRLTVRSRPGRDCTQDFPELDQLAASVGQHRLLLDGELVCLAPDGAPDFAALRKRLTGSQQRGPAARAALIIFDVLHADGRAVRALPYRQRRELLDELALRGTSWQTPECFVGEARELAR